MTRQETARQQFISAEKNKKIWEMLQYGDKLCLVRRRGFTRRIKGKPGTHAAPAIYILFETGTAQPEKKYIVIWSNRAKTVEMTTFGAVWYEFNQLGRLPTQLEVEERLIKL